MGEKSRSNFMPGYSMNKKLQKSLKPKNPVTKGNPTRKNTRKKN